ncbi:sodium channel protein Nach-like [Monomorium pharaonis]|uniref:sodium channel protein Nach-like n=1 Tax=Monomorium pharaonis TaxID=307658 RepID=UPI0017464F10|nr:sodium channel protein Nach-like [Monomorium pharaonis]
MISNTLQHKRRRVKKITVDHVEVPKRMRSNLFNDADAIQLYNRHNIVVKNRKEITHQLFHEYLKESSIHGIKYFSNLTLKSSIIGKLFWIIIMIGTFVFLSIMLEKFWLRYTTNPTRSVIKSFHSPIFQAPFPALTLCPLIPPLGKTRKKVFESLTLPNNMNNSTGRFLVRYGPAMANENNPGGRSHLNELKLLLKTNNMTLLDFLKALRPCEDLFETCFWEGTEKNCSELFKVSYTYTGVCCSFNYHLEEFIETGM